MNELKSRYDYVKRMIPDPRATLDAIYAKRVIPYQVEIQPGPVSGPICWLKCPYCYGGAASDDGARLTPERYVEIMQEIAAGGVKKVIFAGYATDPLNYKHIDQLVNVAVDSRQVIGFHTKALKIPAKLLDCLVRPDVTDTSYFSVSVDAGSDVVYNRVHGVSNLKAKTYSKVIANIRKLSEQCRSSGSSLEIMATYLVNEHNSSVSEIKQAITDLRAAGAKMVRFTFPQMPRGADVAEVADFVPGQQEKSSIMARIKTVIEQEDSADCNVLIRDMDEELNTEGVARTLPCFSRFVFPTVGFDGHLYHCSESASPDFREMSIGNLATDGFWESYYSYLTETLEMERSCNLMNKLSCKCDRKEHAVNATLKSHFNDMSYIPAVNVG